MSSFSDKFEALTRHLHLVVGGAESVQRQADVEFDLFLQIVAADALGAVLGGGFLAAGIAAAAIEDGDSHGKAHGAGRQGIIERRADGAVIAESLDGGKALQPGGAGGEACIGFALLLGLQIGARLERLRLSLLDSDRVYGDVGKLVGEVDVRIEPHVHCAEQLQVGAAAGVLGHQEVLLGRWQAALWRG